MRKLKKRSTLLVVITLLFSLLIIDIANATSIFHSVRKSQSADFTSSVSGSYYLRTYYDYGTALPGDDASAIATAGRPPFHARKVTAYIADGSAYATDTKRSFSMVGSGVQNITVHPVLSGHDQATGYANAYVYNGYASGSDPTSGLTPIHDLRLRIDD